MLVESKYNKDILIIKTNSWLDIYSSSRTTMEFYRISLSYIITAGLGSQGKGRNLIL